MSASAAASEPRLLPIHTFTLTDLTAIALVREVIGIYDIDDSWIGAGWVGGLSGGGIRAG